MSLSQMLAEDRRLVILRALTEVPGYELNEMVLRQALDQFGHHASRDLVRADIQFLDEHRLVVQRVLQAASGELWMVKLTAAGEDVANGRLHVGVARRRVE
jgi:hypothetical protein